MQHHHRKVSNSEQVSFDRKQDRNTLSGQYLMPSSVPLSHTEESKEYVSSDRAQIQNYLYPNNQSSFESQTQEYPTAQSEAPQPNILSATAFLHEPTSMSDEYLPQLPQTTKSNHYAFANTILEDSAEDIVTGNTKKTEQSNFRALLTDNRFENTQGSGIDLRAEMDDHGVLSSTGKQ